MTKNEYNRKKERIMMEMEFESGTTKEKMKEKHGIDYMDMTCSFRCLVCHEVIFFDYNYISDVPINIKCPHCENITVHPFCEDKEFYKKK